MAATKKKDVDIIKLTNLGKNYEISELVETCLAKNQNKLLKIMNENHFSNEDVILILRIFLIKTKRLLNLALNSKPNKNFDEAISKFRPPIFWKDKPIVKKQMSLWTDKKLYELITKINLLEVNIKMNNSISIILMQNFIYELLEFETNNSA